MIVIASSGGRASFPHGWHCPEVASTKKVKGIGSVYKRHPVTKFEHGSHGASKWNFNHMTVY